MYVDYDFETNADLSNVEVKRELDDVVGRRNRIYQELTDMVKADESNEHEIANKACSLIAVDDSVKFWAMELAARREFANKLSKQAKVRFDKVQKQIARDKG